MASKFPKPQGPANALVSSGQMSVSQFIADWPSSPLWLGGASDFSDGVPLATTFTYTQINSGTATILTADATGRKGVCRFDSVGATNNKGAQIQRLGYAIKFVDGKDVRFEYEGFIHGGADVSAFMAGVAVTDTTLLGTAGPSPHCSEGLVFFKPVSSQQLVLNLYSASVLIWSVPIDTLVDDVAAQYAWELQSVLSGSATLLTYKNGTQIGEQGVTGLPTSKVLRESVAFQTGTSPAAQAYMDLDLVGAFQKR